MKKDFAILIMVSLLVIVFFVGILFNGLLLRDEFRTPETANCEKVTQDTIYYYTREQMETGNIFLDTARKWRLFKHGYMIYNEPVKEDSKKWK